LWLAKTYLASKQLILWVDDCQTRIAMLNAIVVSIRFILLIFAGQKQVALENAALRRNWPYSNATLGGQS